ncbi:hypothetical protein LWI28_003722 [Acer negundo]|uniref:Retrotransposon gag domain-containing protein n=1 Tax=Acer negundo TaxID=4023 RepID=A0AAD5J3U1_ACENE|nr:hypothetical protein LWI28_003722 [Acer negundo]
MVTKQDFEQSNQALNDKITAVQNDLGKQILDLTNEMRETFTRIESRFTDLNTHHSPRDRGLRASASRVLPLHRYSQTFRPESDDEPDEYRPPRHAFRGLPTEDHDVRRPPNLIPRRNVDLYRNPYDDRRDFQRRSSDDHFDPARRVKVDAPEFDGRLDVNVFLDWLAAMDDYFEWYPMSDEQKIRFAKLKLVGSAKKYWRNIQMQYDRLGQDPITLWSEMKIRLREKYLPTYYRSALLDQYLNIKQSSSSVNEYMSIFDDLLIRCNIKEEPDVTVARFLNGLKFEVKRVVSIHNPKILEDAYFKALEAEKYLRPYPFKRPPGDLRQTRPSPSEGSQSFNYREVNTSTSNAHFDSRPPIPRDRPVLPSHRTLIIGQEYDNYYPPDLTDEVIEPIEDIHDLDLEADLDNREFEGQLHMMKCIFTKSVSADTWKRTSVFHTFIQCKGKSYKLVIDGGSTMNIVSNVAVTRFQLNPEPHPHPFRVAWVDKTSLPITHRCLVPLSLDSYSETIYCDILPMEVAHILLRRPWLYDLDVKSFGRANTHMFTNQGKTITLQPAKPKDSIPTQTNTSVVD